MKYNDVRNNYGKDYSFAFVLYSEVKDEFIVNFRSCRFDSLFSFDDFKNYYITYKNTIENKSIASTNVDNNAINIKYDIYRQFAKIS